MSQVTDEKPKRTCNRHSDCDAADKKVREAGGRDLPYGGKSYRADHCHDECCEECFGC